MPGRMAEGTPGMRPLYIEDLLWKPREDRKTPSWEGHPNFWVATDAEDGTHLRQTGGINPVAVSRGQRRRPAVAIFVTPPGQGHRLPWLDEVDLDTGFVRYFGDNKPDLGVQAEAAQGNKALLDEMNRGAASDPASRAGAAPLLFFMNLGNAGGRPHSVPRVRPHFHRSSSHSTPQGSLLYQLRIRLRSHAGGRRRKGTGNARHVLD
jgi:AspBHI-like restriction endonuclease